MSANSHYVSVVRGVEGSKYSDFTTGTASVGTGTAPIELRIDDAGSYTKVDVIKALDAFKRFFENAQQAAAAGFVISG